VILGTHVCTGQGIYSTSGVAPGAVFQESTPTMSLTTLLVVVAALLALAAVVAAVLVFRDPSGARHRIESVFRRPERPARTAGDEQYYRPYWTR
jgi:hypothetical protein